MPSKNFLIDDLEHALLKSGYAIERNTLDEKDGKVYEYLDILLPAINGDQITVEISFTGKSKKLSAVDVFISKKTFDPPERISELKN